jgi:outer membrane lipoprotein-sorting protein
MISRRHTLLAALTLAPLVGRPRQAGAATPISLTPQDQADIQRVEAYLNALRTMKAHFFQVTQDGGTSEGTAWLQRPGEMRFQYDPPAPFLLLASSGVLTFHDGSLHQDSNIPLSRTPLGILLADHVTLSGAVTVTAIDRLPGQLQLTVIRTASPGDGSLSLIFTEGPMTLRQWTVVDNQQRVTHVTLSNMLIGGHYQDQLFEQISVPASAGQSVP